MTNTVIQPPIFAGMSERLRSTPGIFEFPDSVCPSGLGGSNRLGDTYWFNQVAIPTGIPLPAFILIRKHSFQAPTSQLYSYIPLI
jgi:hypothetical protein